MKIRFQSNTINLLSILKGIDSGEYVLRPPYQRLLVWREKHKNELVRTVLDGFPFPEIYVAPIIVDPINATQTKPVVDGQQRLNALYSYWKGELLSLPSDILPFKQLNSEQQNNFLSYKVVERSLEEVDENQIVEIFKRLNSTSYTVNTTESAFSEFREGAVFKNAIDLLDHDFFNTQLKKSSDFDEDNEFSKTYKDILFTANDVNRMLDQRYLIEIMMAVDTQKFVNSAQSFEDYLNLNHKDDELMEEIGQRVSRAFEDYLHFTKSVDIPDRRLLKKSDFYTFIIEIDRKIQEDKTINAKLAGDFSNAFSKLSRGENFETSASDLLDFSSKVKIEEIEDYMDKINQQTKTNSSRTTRSKIISRYLDEIYS